MSMGWIVTHWSRCCQCSSHNHTPPSLYHFHASWLYVGFHSQQPAPTSLSRLTILRQLEPDLPRDMESWKCLGVYISWEQPLTSDWQWRELIFQLPCTLMGTILRCVFHCLHNSPLRLTQSNIPWNFASVVPWLGLLSFLSHFSFCLLLFPRNTS